MGGNYSCITWAGYTYTQKTGAYRAPAVEFERATGLQGLSAQWKVPGGISYAEAEARLYPYVNAVFDQRSVEAGDVFWDWSVPAQVVQDARKKVHRAFNKYLSLNPELECLRPVCPDSFREGVALFGIVSQFNSDDILYVCEVKDEDRPHSLRVRQKQLAQRAGAPISNWILSEPTIDRAYDQMEGRAEAEQVAKALTQRAKPEGELTPLRVRVPVPIGVLRR